jgi:hypothetical protein
MVDPKPDQRRFSKIIRWVARLFATLLASFWLFIAVVSLIFEPLSRDPESLIMAFLIMFSIVGVVTAWFRELYGGVLLLVVGLMYCVFAIIVAGHNKAFAVLISGVPFIIAGLLFLASWRESKIAQIPRNGA